MSGFRYLNLDYWKRLAGLDPLPAFIRGYGSGVIGDVPEDFIDARFFSPLALQWEVEALEYLAEGRHLRGSDGELLARIGHARRFGHAPSPAQMTQFRQALKYRVIKERMPVALQRRMWRMGIPYGPDHELDDDVILPSAAEEAFREIAIEWGKTPKQVKARYHTIGEATMKQSLVRTDALFRTATRCCTSPHVVPRGGFRYARPREQHS